MPAFAWRNAARITSWLETKKAGIIIFIISLVTHTVCGEMAVALSSVGLVDGQSDFDCWLGSPTYGSRVGSNFFYVYDYVYEPHSFRTTSYYY